MKRYDLLHGEFEKLHSYFCLTKDNRVFETRGLKKAEYGELLEGSLSFPDRDFTPFLNDWSGIRKKLEHLEG